jgi:membrane protein implicated in regulation of membrane protease activity
LSAFWVVGIIGVALLLATLLLADLFSSLFEGLESFELGDWFSLPVIAGFLAALGIGGGLAESAGLSTGVSALIGASAGVVLGWFALRISRAAAGMTTDDTPRSADMVGLEGHVVTPVAAGSSGEIVIRVSGSPVKLTARAGYDLPTGTDVVVVEVLTSTSVRVESAETFWASQNTPDQH